MVRILLVLTNPYGYEKAISWALHEVQKTNNPLQVTFAIDPNAIEDLMRELGENGWLGIGSRRSLQEAMLEGYRALATDILEEVERRCSELGIPVTTRVEECAIETYLDSVFHEEPTKIIVSGSHALTPLIEKVRAPVEWIPED